MKKLLLSAVISLSAFMLFTGCNNAVKPEDSKQSQTPFDLTAAKKAIAVQLDIFMKAMSSSDSVGLANCYTSDGKLMPPNMPAAEGTNSIQSAAAFFMRIGLNHLTLKTVDAWGNEEGITEEGTWEAAGKDGKAFDHGKYLELWKKENGTWKLFRDCFNSNLPVKTSK